MKWQSIRRFRFLVRSSDSQPKISKVVIKMLILIVICLIRNCMCFQSEAAVIDLSSEMKLKEKEENYNFINHHRKPNISKADAFKTSATKQS